MNSIIQKHIDEARKGCKRIIGKSGLANGFVCGDKYFCGDCINLKNQLEQVSKELSEAIDKRMKENKTKINDDTIIIDMKVGANAELKEIKQLVETK